MVEAEGVARVVVGHTPADQVRIKCGGQLVAADASLSRYFRAHGNLYCPAERARGRDGWFGWMFSRRRACAAAVDTRCRGEIVWMHKAEDGQWRLAPVRMQDDREV